MQEQDFIKYWIDASEIDYKAMQNLFESKDYVWSLFLGHLVIEKLLKATAVQNGKENIPKIHDLTKIAKAAGLNMDENQMDLFDVITSFNIEARYPDYKHEFYKKCDQKFTTHYIDKIMELREWLLTQLKK